MREVGTFEAKTKLSKLLDAVMTGENIIITRHGKQAALLSSPQQMPSRATARMAAQAIRDRAKAEKRGKFDWAEWKTYVNEGRP